MYPENRMELRLEEQEGADRTEIFETAKARLREYLAAQGVHHVTVTLSEDLPRQDAGSGKFKHIVNMQNRA